MKKIGAVAAAAALQCLLLLVLPSPLLPPLPLAMPLPLPLLMLTACTLFVHCAQAALLLSMAARMVPQRSMPRRLLLRAAITLWPPTSRGGAHGRHHRATQGKIGRLCRVRLDTAGAALPIRTAAYERWRVV